jgi:hypothetical protein
MQQPVCVLQPAPVQNHEKGPAGKLSKIRNVSAREELARRVLQTLASGDPIPERDALQLRNWAVSSEDAMLTHPKPAERSADFFR